MSTTWNPSDKSAGITLSAGNLLATTTDSNSDGVRSTTSHTTGKWYAEFTSINLINSNDWVGIMGLAAGLGVSPFGTGFSGQLKGGSYYNYSGLTSGGSDPTGGHFSFAIDCTNGKLWMRTGSGIWNASGTADPATGVGGFDLSGYGAVGTVPLYIACRLDGVGATAKMNAGASSFIEAVPSGFVGWDVPPPLPSLTQATVMS